MGKYIDNIHHENVFCIIRYSTVDFYFRKELLTHVHHLIHLNLAISLFFGYATFVSGIENATSSVVRHNCVFHVICSSCVLFCCSKYCCLLKGGLFRYRMYNCPQLKKMQLNNFSVKI